VSLISNVVGDGVTTFAFIGGTIDQFRLLNCYTCAFYSVTMQGEQDKFILENTDGVTIIGCDIEGQGTFLKYIGNENFNCNISGNMFIGFSGTLQTGFPTGGSSYIDTDKIRLYNKNIQSDSDIELRNINVKGIIKSLTTGLVLQRHLLENQAQGGLVDVEYKNNMGSSYIGINASGDSVIDNRASGSILFQNNGDTKIKVTGSGSYIKKLNIESVSEFSGQQQALAAGLLPGDVYRTGEILKIVF
jgi:hypothetical protein